jgi:hypothetical protein
VHAYWPSQHCQRRLQRNSGILNGNSYRNLINPFEPVSFSDDQVESMHLAALGGAAPGS